MRFPSLFSSKDMLSRARGLVSFARLVRWGLWAMMALSFAALLLDIFIFYRYSYRVVNLKPNPVVRSVTIDREGLQGALEVLDARADKFRELYGSGTTTSRSR